jgi:sensor histidine kinase YesM
MLKSYRKYLEKRVSNLWVFENLRYLPIIGLINLLFFLQTVIVVLINDLEWSYLDIHTALWHMEIIVIPLAAINAVYFAGKWIVPKLKKQSKVMWAKVLATIVGIIIGTAITETVYALNGIKDDDILSFGKIQIDPITTNFISYALFSLFIVIPLFSRQAKQYELQLEIQQKELEIQQAEQLIAQAELETLQAKINPHFLYNSLNSIAGLIHDEPDKAERMVLSLSDLFRYSLNTQNRDYTTVKEEIKMVNTYMDIEKTRFETQLQYIVNIDAEAEPYLIPRFLIQPLVENAIKHGTSKIEKGKMELSVIKKQNGLVIKIADNGPDFPPQMSNGYGVRNVREKLNLLFPDKNEILFNNHPEKYIEIKINQLKTQADEV